MPWVIYPGGQLEALCRARGYCLQRCLLACDHQMAAPRALEGPYARGNKLATMRPSLTPQGPCNPLF